MKILLALFSFLLVTSCASQNTSFKNLEYQAGACFGFCPIFKMTISSDRTVIIEAERFTFTNPKTKDYDPSAPTEGTFKTKLSEANYQELLTTLESIPFSKLEANYGNYNVTDLPTAKLKVEFLDLNSVEIEDYGKRGTPELKALYQFLESLPQSETWTKLN